MLTYMPSYRGVSICTPSYRGGFIYTLSEGGMSTTTPSVALLLLLMAGVPEYATVQLLSVTPLGLLAS